MENEIKITQDDICRAFSEGVSSYFYTKERMGESKPIAECVEKAIESAIKEKITEDLVTRVLQQTISDFLQEHQQEILKSISKSESPKRTGKTGRKPTVGIDEVDDG